MLQASTEEVSKLSKILAGAKTVLQRVLNFPFICDTFSSIEHLLSMVGWDILTYDSIIYIEVSPTYGKEGK